MSLTHGSAFDPQQHRRVHARLSGSGTEAAPPSPLPTSSAAGAWEHPLRRLLVASAFCHVKLLSLSPLSLQVRGTSPLPTLFPSPAPVPRAASGRVQGSAPARAPRSLGHEGGHGDPGGPVRGRARDRRRAGWPGPSWEDIAEQTAPRRPSASTPNPPSRPGLGISSQRPVLQARPSESSRRPLESPARPSGRHGGGLNAPARAGLAGGLAASGCWC